jgi:hypothetical protein
LVVFLVKIDTCKFISEWCAFVDYCVLTPLRLSQARLQQDTPIQPLWIVGAGEFQAPNETPFPSMLSVPAKTSRPELIFLGYVQSKPGLCSGFTWDHSDIIQGIGNTAAVCHGRIVDILLIFTIVMT